MKFSPANIPDVVLIQPKVLGDARGFFLESWNEKVFAEHGINDFFVQDSHSRSAKGVLRGLHYQIRQPQGKLIRVVSGEVFDVVVDMRRASRYFGRSVSVTLKAEDRDMLWVPPGFAHGFYVLSEYAEVLYKQTAYYAPEYERSMLWNDPALSIAWPLVGVPTLSEKDASGVPFELADCFP